MKDRLITLLGAAIAFYLLFRLLFPNISFTDDKISFPTTQDRGKYGIAGLKQWLDTSNVPTFSLRERYQSLISNPQLAETGNLLITSLPQRLASRNNEREQLTNWLRNGNHAVVLIAMSDWPEWADRRRSTTVDSMLSSLDLKMKSNNAQEKPENDSDGKNTDKQDIKHQIDSLIKPQEHARKLTATTNHPISKGIHSLHATWLDSEGINWQLKGRSDPRSMSILFRDNEDLQPAIWMGFMGSGTVIISRHADMFSNVSLGKADNARFVENIISQLLSPTGKIIFDDMHQGLSAIYDPDAFFRDPRLHHTLFFMLALWIIYVMGHTNRFLLTREKLALLNLRDHIKGIGNLFARRLHTSAVALRQAQHFFNEVRSYYGMPQNGQPVWELLEENAAIDSHKLRSVIHTYKKALQHKNVNLVRFINKLNLIRRKLQ